MNDAKSPSRALALRARLEAFLGPLVAGLVLLVTLIGLIASALHDPRPHDIPVGLVGPAAMREQLSQRFGQAAPGAFRFTAYDSEAAAREAIDTRQIDGALVIGPGGTTLIVAGAAGDAITGAITGALGNAFRAQGRPLTVDTVHPFASGDAHGLILFFLVVAVIVSTLVAQAVILVRAAALGVGARLAVLVLYAALAGLVGTATAAFVVGGYGDRFWEVVGLTSLAALAVGAVVAGGARLLGPAGFGLMALIMVLFDLVASGGPIGPALLPDFYRRVGPWMPASLTYSALKGDLYFDRVGVAMPVLVLVLWALTGLALVLLSQAFRSRRQPAAPPP